MELRRRASNETTAKLIRWRTEQRPKETPRLEIDEFAAKLPVLGHKTQKLHPEREGCAGQRMP